MRLVRHQIALLRLLYISTHFFFLRVVRSHLYANKLMSVLHIIHTQRVALVVRIVLSGEVYFTNYTYL